MVERKDEKISRSARCDHRAVVVFSRHLRVTITATSCVSIISPLFSVHLHAPRECTVCSVLGVDEPLHMKRTCVICLEKNLVNLSGKTDRHVSAAKTKCENLGFLTLWRKTENNEKEKNKLRNIRTIISATPRRYRMAARSFTTSTMKGNADSMTEPEKQVLLDWNSNTLISVYAFPLN